MSENRNIGISTASGILAGGIAGGYLGAKNAPSVVGRVDIDKVLARTPYTDVIRDRFYKVGEATGDCFKSARATYFNAEHGPENDARMMFNTLEKDTAANTVTVKELKDAIADGRIRTCTMDNVDQLGNYSKMLGTLDDTKSFTFGELTDTLKQEHSYYKSAKKEIQSIINELPKQKGKYGAICAAIGGICVGLTAFILSSIHANKSEKNNLV